MNIDFEFADDLQRTYRCLTWEGETWLMFQLGEDWMPLNPITEKELQQYRQASMVMAMNF